MPSTDRKLELKAKTSMAQTVSQAAVYAKGLTRVIGTTLLCRALMKLPFLSSLADDVRQEIHQPFDQ
jgi:hypothetical protein